MQFDGSGLSEKQAASLLAQKGKNEIAEGKKKSVFVQFFSQFRDILILILAAGAVFSAAFGELNEALSILAIMLLNAFMGFIQERRTERTLEALRLLSAPTATVIRDGRARRIPASEVTVGDLVRVNSGDRIPADIKIVKSVMLETDESLLTGESRHVKKKVGDSAYMGCCAVSGGGDGLVTATGMDTEMGRIAGLLGDIREAPTPLQQRLAALGRFIAIACVSVCVVVFAVGLINGRPPLEMALTGISLAVAAIPEGLPAVVTIVLSASVGRVVKKGAIIRRLHAVETLGCASVICCDKTGTLTENRMTVSKIYSGDRLWDARENVPPASKNTTARLLRAAALCSNATVIKTPSGPRFEGSPTETALAAAVFQRGISADALGFKRSAELPFDSARKYMSVSGSHAKGEAVTYIKGAPERILQMCGAVAGEYGDQELTGAQTARLSELCSSLASNSFRLIACAEQSRFRTVFLGLFAIEDPLRPEIRAAVSRCKSAGIRAVLITGDHEQTATAVARSAGLSVTGGVISGSQIDGMAEPALCAAVAKVSVFARVTPEHKLRIVRALKKNGEVVAMTGDGVNDAPAVKEADIGVSMGKSGADVTRQASGVVITDDNFATVVAAVEEGRMIYNNIKRFVVYLLTCNLGEVLTVVFGMLLGQPAIFAPIQLLLINLITDGLPAIALGMETDSEGLMERPPRPRNEGLFAGGVAFGIVCRGTVLALSNILCYCLCAPIFGPAVAGSATYIALVVSQMAFVSERRLGGLIRRANKPKNYAVALSVVVSLAATAASIYLPALRGIFSTEPVTGGALLIVAGCVLVGEAIGAATAKISGLRV